MDKCERLQEALKTSGRTVGDVATHLKISPQAVYKWLRDPNMNIRNDHLFAVADYTRYNARWIATGRGPKTPGDDAPVFTEPVATYRITPPDAVTHLVTSIRSMLKVAGLPPDCLGQPATLHAALKNGVPPTTFAIQTIQDATTETLTECSSNLADLTAAQIAQLIIDKLTSWIHVPESPETPTSPPQNSHTPSVG